MTPSPRHAHRSGAISTSTMAAGRIRALTAARPITPTSLRCPSAWQLNLAEAPLIDAEKLFRQPGPRQSSRRSQCYGIVIILAEVIGYLKGKSSIWIVQNVERKLRNFLGHKFWARGYFVSTVGRDKETTIDRKS